MVQITINRQKKRWIVLMFCMMLIPSIQAQVDYSTKSNILNPDTLRGDQKKVFWHFVKLSHKETEELEPLEIKVEFAKIGITTDENDRFVDAYFFYAGTMTNHKKSCENWASFKDLSPKSEH
jgi:hypothetical protein